MKQVVIMPGGFHPFHAGHYALYQQAQQAFPGADVYVAATADTSTRPFPFPLKQKLAKLAGVPADRFVQVKSPFSAQEITAGYNPEDTAVIFVRSEKDRNAVPQPAKRDANGNLPLVTRGPRKGQPVSDYLQFYTGEENLAPMNQHAYIDYLPTVEFGPGMTSATEIRNAWPKLNEKRKTALVMSLYPKTQKNPALAANVVKMLDTVLGAELDEDLSRRGILKGLAGAGALEFQPQQQVNEFAPSGEGGNGPFDYGSAIIKIGETFDDQFPGEGSGQDSADIINVGKTFMTAGMKPGIMALFDLDTMVYEQVLDELTDQDFNVQQDLYQPYLTYMNAGTAPSGTAPAGNAPGTLYLPANSNETQIILALLKEFIKVHQNDQEYRQAVEGIYKAFQQSLQAGFQALNTAWDLNIDADFGQFAGRYGVDLNAIADRHGLSDEDDDDDLEEGVAEDYIDEKK